MAQSVRARKGRVWGGLNSLLTKGNGPLVRALKLDQDSIKTSKLYCTMKVGKHLGTDKSNTQG